MRRLAPCLLIATLGLASASAQPQQEGRDRPVMAAGIAQDRIEVEVNYSDSRVVVFAATPQPENPTSGLAVALVGPQAPQRMIRRTAAGDQRIEFVAAPLVFAIGAEKQVEDSVSSETMIQAGLNAQASALPRIDQLLSPDLDAWRAAFVNLKMEQGLYTFGAHRVPPFRRRPAPRHHRPAPERPARRIHRPRRGLPRRAHGRRVPPDIHAGAQRPRRHAVRSLAPARPGLRLCRCSVWCFGRRHRRLGGPEIGLVQLSINSDNQPVDI